MVRIFVIILLLFTAASPLADRALAQTPVDIFQDMESANPGDILNSTIVSGSAHGGLGSWSVENSSQTFKVAASNTMPLRGPVSVGGTTYSGASSTRSWVINDNTTAQRVVFTPTNPHNQVTVAGFLTLGVPGSTNNNEYDAVVIDALAGNPSVVLQMVSSSECMGSPKNACIRLHTTTPTTKSAVIHVMTGKPYWINLMYDAANGKSKLAVFDPALNYAQVENELSQNLNTGKINLVRFGRVDTHPVNPGLTQSFFDNFIINYDAKSAVPFIPAPASGGNNPSSPSNLRVNP